jgi:hypothetical protein
MPMPRTPWPKMKLHPIVGWNGVMKFAGFGRLRIGPGRAAGKKAAAAMVNVEAGAVGPSDAQTAALEYLQENPDKVIDAALRAIAKWAPAGRKRYARIYPRPVLDEMLPKSATPAELAQRLSLRGIGFHKRQQSGVAEIDLEFDAAWDEEHGVAVVMHRNRVKSVGLPGDE